MTGGESSFRLPGADAALHIDQASYVAWFGASTDDRSEGCDKIGQQVNGQPGA